MNSEEKNQKSLEVLLSENQNFDKRTVQNKSLPVGKKSQKLININARLFHILALLVFSGSSVYKWRY